ncbi:MAG: autoinducer 2 ABC transporter substrate-binding protein [Spirochaetaceae bacterium]|jgi:simple sugar transport system substrate-binding protein|nr:autoinducer 2 ABC transporter substrate-binding protein [Spirochaetaceae bacterium]
MKGRGKLMVVLSALVIAFLAACGGNKSNGAGKVYTIATVVKDMSDPWCLRHEEGVLEFAKASGFNCYVKGPPKTDSAQQIQVMEELIAQGIDALCVVPIDPEACEPVLKRAREQGIVVISHEAPGMVNVDFNIEAFDNRAYGAYMMDELAKVTGAQGEYITMVAFLSSVSHNEWMDAAIAHQKTAYPNMILAPEQKIECEDNMELAYEKTKEMIKKYPGIKGFLGASSYDPPGAGKAIDELGKTGQIFAVGTSVPSVAAPYLSSGSNPAVLCWDPALSGKAMLELAVMILDGRKDQIKTGLDLGIEGYESVKADGNMLSGAGWLVITKDNMDQYQF